MMCKVNPLEVIRKYSDSVPVPVNIIADKLGIDLTYVPLDNDLSGYIERTIDNSYRIVVNSDHALTRRRFTAAHEIGHFIYHRSLLGSGVGDTRAYRSVGTKYHNTQITASHERQANSFAANLLMPARAIHALRDEGITSPQDLADRLGVSKQAMCIRLGVPCE